MGIDDNTVRIDPGPPTPPLHIVQLSGGKDSTAMLIEMLRRGMRVDRIQYADVGEMAEFVEMYPYIDRVEAYIGRPVVRLKSKKHTARSIFYGYPTRGKHMDEIRGFPLTIGAGCRYRSWLKSDVLEEAAGAGNIIYIGFAAGEERRAESSEYTKSKRNQYRFPLIEWGMTEQDCLAYTRRIGLWNPLYDHFSRLGCFWCTKQPIGSLRSLYYHYPHYWAVLRQMEHDQGRPFQYNRTVRQLEERFEREREKYSA